MIAASSIINSTTVIDNKITEMEKVVALVEQFGAAHNIPNQVINEFNLCLDEILNNTISYGYDDGDSHCIRVTLALADGAVTAEVVDDGKPFDPRPIQRGDLSPERWQGPKEFAWGLGRSPRHLAAAGGRSDSHA